jgi:1-acyl-sn-glycerol-3-phosphate acyltransferase
MEPKPLRPARAGRSLAQRGACATLTLLGWRRVLVEPPAAHGIIIVYPHTSNWDFLFGVLYKIGVGLPIRWMGKHSLFRWPLRRILLRLGGVPVRRDQRSGFVAALLAEFARRDWMWIAITPEGTRARTAYWKSGFYRLAVAGHLPVGLGFIDYATRTVGVDQYLTLSGDEAVDFAKIRMFYADKHGRRPDKQGAIGLRP